MTDPTWRDVLYVWGLIILAVLIFCIMAGIPWIGRGLYR